MVREKCYLKRNKENQGKGGFGLAWPASGEYKIIRKEPLRSCVKLAAGGGVGWSELETRIHGRIAGWLLQEAGVLGTQK